MSHLPRLTLAAVVLLMVSHGTVLTQRARPQTMAAGGQVVAADSGEPLANARILHNLQPIAWTDRSGRFDVVVARESGPLQIEKPGFVRQAIARPGPGVTVRMIRAATLTVRIVTEAGEPVPWRRFRVAGSEVGIIATSDDRGEHRLTGLPPGDYAADLEDLAAPQATVPSDRAEQSLRLTEARTRTRENRDLGQDLRAGAEGRITLTVPAPASRPGRRGRNAGGIRGRILGPDGTPLASARVTLKGPLSETSGVTDVTGSYAFEGVSAGTYKVHASAAGLVPREFGQDAPGARGRDVQLMPGETLDHIDVPLPRGGTISGRLLDGRGEPYERFSVSLVLRVKEEDSERRRLWVAAGNLTDELGRFRISGVPPGTYYLAALPPRGRSEGVVFHPGRLQMSEASEVIVKPGVEVADMDFAIDWTDGASVSGTVLDPDGKPMRSGNVSMERASWVAEAVVTRQVPIRNDGTFAFLNVPQGEYVLRAGLVPPLSAITLNIDGLTQFPVRVPLRAATGGTTLVVSRPEPVSLEVRTSLKSTLSGRLVAEGGGVLEQPSAFELIAVRGRVAAVVRGDATFDIPNLSGTTRFSLAAAPRGWWLKALTIGSVNTADTPVTFQDGSQSRYGVVALVARTGDVSGRVLAGGEPAARSSVAVFPVAREKWYEGSRYVRSTQADNSGSFTLDAPPGEYLIAAVVGKVDLTERSLARLASSAARITVKEGEMVTQDVRVTRP